MWLTCLIRRKRPVSSRRLPPRVTRSLHRREPIVSLQFDQRLRSASQAGCLTQRSFEDKLPPIRAGSAEARGTPPEENTNEGRISVEGRDGSFNAYIARPKTLPAPAVVVLQELFGVNADIRKHCDELAEQGFLAVAPDLFWRQEPGADLSVTSEADWSHGLRLYGAYDRDAGANDVKDTINAVRNLRECNGKVALLGYCLGALMVFLTAVLNSGVDAAVAYHGGDTEKYLGEVDGLNAPLLMHLAEGDEFISKAAKAALKAALANKRDATVYSYPGQNHAFTRNNGAHYNAAAAALANGRTSEFLHRQLRWPTGGRARPP